MSERNDKFTTGDQVQLISGGPVMTVQKYDDLRDGYKCQWFAGKKLDFGIFAEDSLQSFTATTIDSEVKKK